MTSTYFLLERHISIIDNFKNTIKTQYVYENDKPMNFVYDDFSDKYFLPLLSLLFPWTFFDCNILPQQNNVNRLSNKFLLDIKKFINMNNFFNKISLLLKINNNDVEIDVDNQIFVIFLIFNRFVYVDDNKKYWILNPENVIYRYPKNDDKSLKLINYSNSINDNLSIEYILVNLNSLFKIRKFYNIDINGFPCINVEPLHIYKQKNFILHNNLDNLLSEIIHSFNLHYERMYGVEHFKCIYTDYSTIDTPSNVILVKDYLKKLEEYFKPDEDLTIKLLIVKHYHKIVKSTECSDNTCNLNRSCIDKNINTKIRDQKNNQQKNNQQKNTIAPIVFFLPQTDELIEMNKIDENFKIIKF